jgi:hypothetical protein
MHRTLCVTQVEDHPEEEEGDSEELDAEVRKEISSGAVAALDTAAGGSAPNGGAPGAAPGAPPGQVGRQAAVMLPWA